MNKSLMARALMGPQRGQEGTQSGRAVPEWEDTWIAPWTLPRELIGDKAYRYQGVAMHGLLGLGGALAGQPEIAIPNLGYAGYSLLSGRTSKRPNWFFAPPDEQTFKDIGVRR
jgi:hypothetical protein